LEWKSLVYCTICGTKNEEDAKYCKKCGANLEVSLEKKFERRTHARAMNGTLLALGIILLVIGLGASLYYEKQYLFGIEYQRTYPYQTIGTVLVVIGALLAVVGALYPSLKEEMTKQVS